MEALNLKTELKNLIESEQDSSILLAIKALLQKKKLKPVLTQKLTSRALKSEEDIKAGRTFSYKEARLKSDELLKKWS